MNRVATDYMVLAGRLQASPLYRRLGWASEGARALMQRVFYYWLRNGPTDDDITPGPDCGPQGNQQAADDAVVTETAALASEYTAEVAQNSSEAIDHGCDRWAAELMSEAIDYGAEWGPYGYIATYIPDYAGGKGS